MAQVAGPTSRAHSYGLNGSPLSTLPAELRNAIYELVLVTEEHIQIEHKTFSADIPVPLWTSPPILQTCRQIRNEASTLYYALNTFNIDCWPSEVLTTWLSMIDPEQHTALGEIRLDSHLLFAVDVDHYLDRRISDIKKSGVALPHARISAPIMDQKDSLLDELSLYAASTSDPTTMLGILHDAIDMQVFTTKHLHALKESGVTGSIQATSVLEILKHAEAKGTDGLLELAQRTSDATGRRVSKLERQPEDELDGKREDGSGVLEAEQGDASDMLEGDQENESDEGEQYE